jgi:hypothetical protein
VAQAAEQVFRRGAQVDHVRALAQQVAVELAQRRAAAGGQHAFALAREAVDLLRFQVAEGRLAVQLEVRADRHADVQLDLVVGVVEGQAELPSELAPDGGLATAGHADEGDQGHGAGSGWRALRAAKRREYDAPPPSPR